MVIRKRAKKTGIVNYICVTLSAFCIMIRLLFDMFIMAERHQQNIIWWWLSAPKNVNSEELIDTFYYGFVRIDVDFRG